MGLLLLLHELIGILLNSQCYSVVRWISTDITTHQEVFGVLDNFESRRPRVWEQLIGLGASPRARGYPGRRSEVGALSQETREPGSPSSVLSVHSSIRAFTDLHWECCVLGQGMMGSGPLTCGWTSPWCLAQGEEQGEGWSAPCTSIPGMRAPKSSTA